MSIAENIAEIRALMVEANRKSPHPDEPVALVAVTKNRSIAEIAQVIAAGERILGENRVQELRDKFPQVSAPVTWHLIGHLQQNKVKYITDKVQLLHSLESLTLAEELNKRLLAENRVMSVLVQVNIVDEASKSGLAKEEVQPFLAQMGAFPALRVVGLMNMAPHFADPEEARASFREMYGLFTTLKALALPRIEMNILSMGMSHDFTVAIEEGANMIRVGSRIFE